MAVALLHKRSGIYKIFNKNNGKFYIGSASDLGSRFRRHKIDLRRGNHKNKYLQNAWNKHGEESFDFIVIEYLEKNKKLIIEREQYWLDRLMAVDAGYNISNKASSQLGFRHSKETKAIISWHSRNQSEESRRKRGDYTRGKKMSPECRAKRSAKMMGRKLTPEHLTNLRSGYKVRKFKTNAKDICGTKKSKKYTQVLFHWRKGENISAS